MNVFGIGLPEMALIMIVALLVFGPKKLPEIGRSMGKAIKGFQDASKEFETEFKREAERIEKPTTTTMQAKLEEPEPKAIASGESAESETQDAEIVEEPSQQPS
ncbi:TatA/E family twin arginine-targeting protein translocase [Microcoleus sp. FACHB-1515]|uniref:TatA/E family twin arginine-targeting protein translocase n=1 Tax=Cyanophyceae TaxID=3028117 RepID=UPI0016860DDD|nr:TatA/E family twin arginine-targeting protein translocase [Microcoleus sp. FACHB-1515]MBD2091066.1 TatA/E family twin arginine-targeting protein translocase [Microcoleus sp. FACHB-1515]